MLEEEGLASLDLGQRLRMMTKFRSRLVHLYGEVDEEYVCEFMREDLNDIVELRKVILRRYEE